MADFPRTDVGGVSLPRLICGTNWMLGYSHTSSAKDKLIKDLFDNAEKIGKVIEVFARNGCNAVMSPMHEGVRQAIRDVEQKTGAPVLWIVTPGNQSPDPDVWKKIVDEAKEMGADFCFPHQCMTDPRIDRLNKCLAPDLMEALRYVRSAGMIPGLSTHTPEAIPCSDSCGADVETYIQPYNAAGFLCQVETDWLQRLFRNAKKPVMTIKPLAAGRLLPPTGLAFSWSTLRDCDMVTLGTMSTYEAEESIEISRACIERRDAEIKLQYTRSKAALATAP